MKVMDSPMGLGLTVDAEDANFLSDAIRCYINGADAGTSLSTDDDHWVARPPRR